MRTILILLLLSFIYSCSNDQNSNEVKIDSTENINSIDNSIQNNNQDIYSSQNFNDSLLNILSKISINLRSNLLNNFFIDTQKISHKKVSNNSFQFYFSENNYYERENISFLNSLTKKNIICFSGFYYNASGITSYFYFLQNINGKWVNISQFVIKNDIISLLEKNINTKILYKKTNNVYSFTSEKSNIPFYFSFEKNSKILFYSDTTWNKLAYIKFSEGKFLIRSVDNKKAKMNVLTADELENCKIYYDLNKAVQDSQFVYILDLSGNSFDNLSPKISTLSKIQILILNDNKYSYLPETIKNLNKLQILRINNNNLENFPEGIGILPNLEEISASYNNLSELPESLSFSKSIKILNLDHNNLTSFFEDCSNLNNLVILNLSYNNITQLSDNFGSMDNLVSIDISNNPISSLPDNFFNIKNLVYLNISNTDITDETLVKIMDTYPDLSITMD